MTFAIPTEPIGSIPRPLALVEAAGSRDGGDPVLNGLNDDAIRDTIARFEATGSPVVTDGEQRKYHNFLTYCVHGLANAVISPSALSLMYPPDEIPGYTRDQFVRDLSREHETEVRSCLRKGAHAVQIDFTEGRLAIKLDPSGGLLNSFIELNNLALATFSDEDRKRIGALAGEQDRIRLLRIIRKHLQPSQRVFIGVVAPIDPRVETAEEIRDRVLEAAEIIPLAQLGTTDDCGFSPFCDDTSTSRDTAFEKIRARVRGTALASEILGKR